MDCLKSDDGIVTHDIKWFTWTDQSIKSTCKIIETLNLFNIHLNGWKWEINSLSLA